MQNTKLSDIRFLIIDDNPAVIKIIGWLAQSIGISHIMGAMNAGAGLNQLVLFKPDIVFVDINMPQTDGLSFLKFVRGHDNPKMRRLPIVTIAGVGGQFDAARSINQGANEFLIKPVSVGLMKTHMENCLFNPRIFIEQENYTGPDRRRARGKSFAGTDRRANRGTIADRRMAS